MGVSPRFFGMSRLVTFLILLSAIVVQFHNIEVAGYPGQPLMKASLAPDDTKMEVHPGYGGLSPGYGGLSPRYGGLSPGYGGLSPGYGGLSTGYGGLSPGYGGLSPGYGGLSPGHLTPCGMRRCQCKGGRHWFQLAESLCPPGCG